MTESDAIDDADAGSPPSTSPRRAMRILAPIISAAVMVAGIIAIVVTAPQTASLGWFAYAPLSGTVFSPEGTVVVGRGAIAGAAAVALGFAGLAFWAGFTVATSRRRPNPTPPSTTSR